MNIFYLSRNPKICAEWHVDSHVHCQMREYSQLLSGAHRYLDGKPTPIENPRPRGPKVRWVLDDPDMDFQLYEAGWLNHPCTHWVHYGRGNYLWLYELLKHLAAEFRHRYHAEHDAWSRLEHLLANPPKNIPDLGWIQPYQAMHEQFMVLGSTLQAYRENYKFGKHHLAVWTARDPPPWYLVPGSEIVELNPGKTGQKRLRVVNPNVKFEVTPIGKRRGIKP